MNWEVIGAISIFTIERRLRYGSFVLPVIPPKTRDTSGSKLRLKTRINVSIWATAHLSPPPRPNNTQLITSQSIVGLGEGRYAPAHTDIDPKTLPTIRFVYACCCCCCFFFFSNHNGTFQVLIFHYYFFLIRTLVNEIKYKSNATTTGSVRILKPKPIWNGQCVWCLIKLEFFRTSLRLIIWHSDKIPP